MTERVTCSSKEKRLLPPKKERNFHRIFEGEFVLLRKLHHISTIVLMVIMIMYDECMMVEGSVLKCTLKLQALKGERKNKCCASNSKMH